MKYTDSKSRAQVLTFSQFCYLERADRGGFDAGWGGMDSTLTVRLMEERGLITLRRNGSGSYPRWRVTGATKLGAEVLGRWKARGSD